MSARGKFRAVSPDENSRPQLEALLLSPLSPAETPRLLKPEVPPLLRQKSTGAMAAAALDLLIEQMRFETLKGAFDRYDENGDGYLSADEVDAALQSVGVHFTPSQLDAFIRLGNTENGYLSEAEFLGMVRRARRGHKAAAAAAAADPPPPRAPGRAGAVAPPPRVPPPPPPQPPAAPTQVAPARRRPPPKPRAATAAAAGPRSKPSASIDLEERLSGVIGLEPIKEKLRGLRDTLVKRRFRKDVGAPLVDTGPLHMIFVGNPGCGKTSIARLLAQLLFDLGAVKVSAACKSPSARCLLRHPM